MEMWRKAEEEKYSLYSVDKLYGNGYLHLKSWHLYVYSLLSVCELATSECQS